MLGIGGPKRLVQRQELAAANHPLFAELNRLDVTYVDLPTGHWPMWSRRPCSRPTRQATALAATDLGWRIAWSSTNWSRWRYSAARTGASPTRPARPPRCRRRDEWIRSGVMDRLEQIARESYDRLIGLQLNDVIVDGCITKALRWGDGGTEPGGSRQAGHQALDCG